MKEEKQINRPLVYLAGGLVLGETMALGMTGILRFGPAALISAFLCVAGFSAVRKRGKAGGWGPAFLLVLSGLWVGIFRMEQERENFREEEERILKCLREERAVTGTVLDVGETGYGSRLLLGACTVTDTSGQWTVGGSVSI